MTGWATVPQEPDASVYPTAPPGVQRLGSPDFLTFDRLATTLSAHREPETEGILYHAKTKIEEAGKRSQEKSSQEKRGILGI